MKIKLYRNGLSGPKYQRLVAIVKRQRWHAASFLINVRDMCKTSQVATDTIVNGVVGLINVHSGILLVRQYLKLTIYFLN